MKPRQNSRLALALGGVGVMLLSMAVHAETFGATVTVQNTLAVTNLQDMDLGTIFATRTADAAQGVAVLELSATGALTTPAVNPNVSIFDLSTAQAARAGITATIPFNVTLPQAEANLATITDDTAGAAIRADGIQLIHESASPTVAKLYLVNFRLGNVSAGATFVQQPDEWVYRITPGIDPNIAFGIGATLTTEPIPAAGNIKLYQSGVYSGTFDVTASY